MSTGDEDRLKRKYSEIARHLKTCWAFEQFHHRLERSLPGASRASRDSYFTAAYDELKRIADQLGSGQQSITESRLEELETRLRGDASRLREENSTLSAADLRRFVGRVRPLDEELMVELLRFYLLASRGRAWDGNLTDKVDFLLSRLGEEVSGPLLRRDRARLSARLHELWSLAKRHVSQQAVIGALRADVVEVADKVVEIDSLEDLQASGTISRYRKLKHALGPMFVEPSIARAILRTNAAIGRKVQGLYNEEEWAIAASFSRLEELQTSVGLDDALRLELDSLRLDVERLQEGRRLDDVRIDAVRRVKEQTQAVLPQIESLGVERSDTTSPLEAGVLPGLDQDEPHLPALEELATDLLDKLLGQLETLLAASGSLEEAEIVLQDPSLPLGLERREVEAFLLVRDDASVDPDLDRLLLTAASIRLRLSILHDHLEAATSRVAELEAVSALELADELIARFSRRLEELESRGATAESSDIRLLKVLLMRDYATLWLEVNGAS